LSILEDFLAWEAENEATITLVQDLLSEALSGEPERLIKDLTIIESWGSRIGELLAEANSYLDRSKMTLKPSRSDENTELDRKCLLDGIVAPVRLVRDRLEIVHDAIKTRITLGQSLLKFHTQMREPRVLERPF